MNVLLAVLVLVGCAAGRTLKAAKEISQEQAYIVGGQEVWPPGLYPWQGVLESNPVIGEGSLVCGCVLLTEEYVLTAAHCVTSDPNARRAVFGAHDRNTQLDGQPETHFFQTVFIHPDYNPSGNSGFANDMAMYRLAAPIDVENNNYISPIGLPRDGVLPEDFTDSDCYISGWGRLTGGGSLPNLLQHTEIPVIPSAECQQIWDPYPIGPWHVCVFERDDQNVGACNGDSGGPLVCRADGESDFELVGLTSWGLSGCGTTYPSVYVFVSYFNDWIRENMQ